MNLSDYNPKNILLIDLRYIGDAIFLIPIIKNLRANLPSAKISALVIEGGDSLLSLLPELTEAIPFKRQEIKRSLKNRIIKFLDLIKKIRERHFDTVIIIPQSDRPTIIGYFSGAKVRIGYESRSWWRNHLLTHKLKYDYEKNIHLIEHNLQILKDLGLKIYDTSITLTAPKSTIEAISKRFNIPMQRDKKSILIHPGARGYLRQWGVENFAKVINALIDKFRVYLVAGNSEKDLINKIALSLKKRPSLISSDLALTEFTALCSISDIFLGNDSAPIHIAAATGMFVVGLYGPTLSKYCKPWTDKSLLFDISPLPCRQCEQDRCLGPEIKACILEIKPEEVIEGIFDVFKKI
ncbi:MAG: glycosyltransferase family 9 protein [Thermodesulfovibrionales bacterium]|nr:glycosyltransferase family 9 protein [Thermodesulfovibrionales bacterium]